MLQVRDPFCRHSRSNLEGPDHYFLRGASIATLSAFFGAYIFQAIDESELRNWEKENRHLETTHCVEMQLLRDQTSRHGILKLRIGWRLGKPTAYIACIDAAYCWCHRTTWRANDWYLREPCTVAIHGSLALTGI